MSPYKQSVSSEITVILVAHAKGSRSRFEINLNSADVVLQPAYGVIG